MEIVLPIIDQRKCTLCGACVEQCGAHSLAIMEQHIVFVQPDKCTYCGDCEAVCPQGAIRVEYEITW